MHGQKKWPLFAFTKGAQELDQQWINSGWKQCSCHPDIFFIANQFLIGWNLRNVDQIPKSIALSIYGNEAPKANHRRWVKIKFDGISNAWIFLPTNIACIYFRCTIFSDIFSMYFVNRKFVWNLNFFRKKNMKLCPIYLDFVKFCLVF